MEGSGPVSAKQRTPPPGDPDYTGVPQRKPDPPPPPPQKRGPVSETRQIAVITVSAGTEFREAVREAAGVAPGCGCGRAVLLFNDALWAVDPDGTHYQIGQMSEGLLRHGESAAQREAARQHERDLARFIEEQR
jgi:hypothetical protein